MTCATVGWPRVNVSCTYRVPLRFNDTVEVRLFVKKLTTRSVTYLFQFRKGGEQSSTGMFQTETLDPDDVFQQGVNFLVKLPIGGEAHDFPFFAFHPVEAA